MTPTKLIFKHEGTANGEVIGKLWFGDAEEVEPVTTNRDGSVGWYRLATARKMAEEMKIPLLSFTPKVLAAVKIALDGLQKR